jgi:DNA-binding MarR family transcriptional regulator
LPKGINGWAISYFFDNSDKDIFQKDFENEFSIRRSTASNILKTMEQNGFITRESVASDARLKKIVLTEKAINIHKSVLKSINEREERLRNGLTRDEIDDFLKIIDKLIKNMEERND